MTDLEDTKCVGCDLIDRTRDKLIDPVGGVDRKRAEVDLPLKGCIIENQTPFRQAVSTDAGRRRHLEYD